MTNGYFVNGSSEILGCLTIDKGSFSFGFRSSDLLRHLFFTYYYKHRENGKNLISKSHILFAKLS